MPLAIWKVPQFARVMGVIALGFACFTGFLGFTWSLWFQQIDRATPIQVATGAYLVNIRQRYFSFLSSSRACLQMFW